MPDTARHLAALPDPDDRGADNGAKVERHVLGTAMESPAELVAMRLHVTAESFADPRHGEIWATICAAADAGEPTNATAITERLIRSGILGRLPSAAYTFEIHQQSLPGQGAYWARLLGDRHTWRQLDVKGARLGQALRTPGATVDQIVGIAEDVIATANTPAPGADEGTHIAALAADYIDTYFEWGKTPTVATPWHDLNRLLASGGFERGQVVTFGGATSMGKSIAITDCARHIGVEQQVPVLMFTLEMTAEQVLYRVLSALTGIPEQMIKGRNLSPDDLVRVDDARRRFQDSPLWIHEGSRSMTQITNTVRRHTARHGAPYAVVIDYLQLVKTDGRKENRQLEVSATMQRMKELALNEQLLVVTASQVNRAPNQRTDKRPTLADLRESGEIENSSDIVILIHRDEYYDPETPRAGEADFIVAKQRGGVRDTVTVAAQLHLTRFVSMAETWTPSRLVAA